MTEFRCLHDLANKGLFDMKTKAGVMKHIKEYLMTSCFNLEITKIGEIDAKHNNENTVKIEVINMPTLRYVRRVTFTKLDFIGRNF